MSEFASAAPAVGPEPRRRCVFCGELAEGATQLVPDVCWLCRDVAPIGPPWRPGEVGYELSMSADRAEQLSGYRPRLDPYTVGPLRSKAVALELAHVWQAELREVVPVPAVHSVGADLVTAE